MSLKILTVDDSRTMRDMLRVREAPALVEARVGLVPPDSLGPLGFGSRVRRYRGSRRLETSRDLAGLVTAIQAGQRLASRAKRDCQRLDRPVETPSQGEEGECDRDRDRRADHFEQGCPGSLRRRVRDHESRVNFGGDIVGQLPHFESVAANWPREMANGFRLEPVRFACLGPTDVHDGQSRALDAGRPIAAPL